MTTRSADFRRLIIQLLTIGAVGALCMALSMATAGCLDQLFAGAGTGDDDPAITPTVDAATPGGDYCDRCYLPEDCGGSGDWCLANFSTHERFCGQACVGSDCPEGSSCVSLTGDSENPVFQCVPDAGSCGLEPAGCDPACDGDAGLECHDARCYRAGPYLAERALCLRLVNAYRARLELPPLLPDPVLEDCARDAAEVDAETGIPHGHYDSTGGCGFVATGATEIAGWPLATFGTVDALVDYGVGTLWAEGEGTANYETLVSNFEALGCGVYVTPADEVWLVLAFR